MTMCRFTFVMVMIILTIAPSHAQMNILSNVPEKPMLIVRLEPNHIKTRGAYVQGQIHLSIQLVSPTTFEKLNLKLPIMEDVRVFTLQKPSTRKVNTYALDGYVYETKIALFPQKSGLLRIPPIIVSGAIARGRGKREAFTEVHPEIVIPIKPMDANYGPVWWLVADNVMMTQTWSSALDTLKAGDTVRRTINLTVAGATVEQLPNFEHDERAGYAVVGTEVSSKTKLTGEGVIAELEQSWDLRIETEDVVTISPIRLYFWNPRVGAQAVATLPSRRIEPLPRDTAERQAQLMNDAINTHQNRRIGLYAALSIPLLALLALMLMVFYRYLPTRADRVFARACAAGATPASCYRAVNQWSRASFGGNGRGLIERLQRQFGGEARTQLDTLQHTLFATSSTPTVPDRLSGSLVSAARRLRLRQFWQRLSAVIHWLVGTHIKLDKGN